MTRFPSPALWLGLFLATLHVAAIADDPTLRPSARLLFRQPELLQAGSCVIYREGGAGWLLTEPVYYLKGRVIRSEVATRTLSRCPATAQSDPNLYSREEIIRLAKASPCVSDEKFARQEQFGRVLLAAEEWETPWARTMANRGRLYQGNFLDQKLEKGMQLELEADLLSRCDAD